MTTLVLENDPLAVHIEIVENKIIVTLDDERTLTIPLVWYPRLLNANPKERANWKLLGDGYAIEWVDIDEHIGVEGLLAGRRSGESQASFDRWLQSRSLLA
jgi:hypothetical protein